jgi:DNA-binding Lrp family transcriptional regulator
MTGMDPLLQLLEKNALLSPENIARQLNLKPAEVKKKIEQYEKQQVILGYRAVINDDKLNLDHVKAVIEVKITPEREGGFNRIANRIAKFDGVTSCFLMSGGYDLLVFVEGRNLKEVAAFVSEKLATLEGVLSTATHFMLKTYKEQGVLMEGDEEYDRLKVSP